jgi:transcription initiation factor IIE alpha subunit
MSGVATSEKTEEVVVLSPTQKAILDDLARYVIHMFYDGPHIVLLELLLAAGKEVSEKDLSITLKLPIKQIHKYLSELSLHGLLKPITKRQDTIISEAEGMAPGAKKWQYQMFWYIDYKHFVDVVKYKIHKMGEEISKRTNDLDVTKYICPNPKCRSKFTAYDAIQLHCNQFRCDKCKEHPPLEIEDASQTVAEIQQKEKRINEQLQVLKDQVKKTQSIKIPQARISYAKESTRLAGQPGKFRPQKTEIVVDIVDITSTKVEQEETQDQYLKKYEEMLKRELSPAEDLSPRINGKEEKKEKEEVQPNLAANILVKIGNKLIPIDQVTEEDEKQMTAEEYTIFAEQLKEAELA